MPTLDDFIFLSPRSKEAISALIMFKKRAIEFGNERIIANDRPRSAYQTDTPIPEEIWDPSIVEGSEDDGTGRQPQCCPPTTEASSDEGQRAAPSARLRRPVSTRDDNPGPLERGARDSFGSRAINTTSRKSGAYALGDGSASSSPSTDATITPSRFQGIPKVSRSSAQVPKGSPSRQQMGVYTEGAPVEEEALSEFEDTDSSLSPEPTTMPPHQAVRLVNVNDKSKFMLFEGIWFERVHGKLTYPPTEQEIREFLEEPCNTPCDVFPHCKSINGMVRLSHKRADHWYLCRVNVDYTGGQGWKSTPMCNTVIFGVENLRKHVMDAHLRLG